MDLIDVRRPECGSVPTELDAETLISRLTDAPAAQVRRFWAEVAERGTPISSRVSPTGDVDVTFLWRASANGDDPAAPDAVHLHLNRVTDKDDHESGMMHHVPGTDIWALTLRVPAALRAGYGFTPLRRGEQSASGPREPGTYRTLVDPLNAQASLTGSGVHGVSVWSGPLAPAQPDWLAGPMPPGLRGSVLRESLALPGDGRPRDHWLYAPAGGNLPDSQALPLLTLFDAQVWFGEMSLDIALDSAIAAGRIPPVLVLGVSAIDRADRVQRLGADSAFLRDVAGPSTEWAQQRAAEWDLALADRRRRLVAGQSLGGLSALVATIEQPEAYGTALAHSPSMWWTPDGRSTPRDLADQPDGGWITSRFSESEVRDVRVRVDVGSREGLTLRHASALHHRLRERGWPGSGLHRHEGGHDVAWWRGALLDGLGAALFEST